MPSPGGGKWNPYRSGTGVLPIYRECSSQASGLLTVQSIRFEAKPPDKDIAAANDAVRRPACGKSIYSDVKLVGPAQDRLANDKHFIRSGDVKRFQAIGKGEIGEFHQQQRGAVASA